MTEQKALGGSEDSLNEEKLEWIRELNEYLPSTVEKCVRHLFQEKVQEPNAEAICSRDGSLIYEELDAHATFLTTRLIHHGV